MTQTAALSGAGTRELHPPRPSWVSVVVRATLTRFTAQLGLVWLGFTAFLAVFAPFIANSHPYVIKLNDGQWSFPLFRHLTPVDVILPVVVCALVGLLAIFWRWHSVSAGTRALLFVGIALALTAVVSIVSLVAIRPPLVHNYGAARQLQRDGQVAWMVRAPIPYSPRDRQRDLGDRRYEPPTVRGYFTGAGYLMGTEQLGADVASRMVHAARIAMSIGFIATGIALVIGVTIGGLMGYFSGIVDLLGMRLVEMISAVPTLFLILTCVAVIPPAWNPWRLYLIMVIIGVTGWVGYARFVRAEFLKLRNQDYVQAARACGLPLHSILFRHLLPNGVAPVLVEASFGVAGAILTEATLSFIGVGLVDEPSWGQMLAEATSSTGGFKWWMAVFPGMAIFLTVFAYNLVGEALRDALDPHSKRQLML